MRVARCLSTLVRQTGVDDDLSTHWREVLQVLEPDRLLYISHGRIKERELAQLK